MTIQILVISIFLLGVAILGMAFNIIFRKKRFPQTHIGRNKDMKRIGIVCAQSMDKIEQKKAKEILKYKRYSNVKIDIEISHQ